MAGTLEPRVTIHGTSGAAYEREPVTFGVPFPQGQLPPGTPVCVMEADGSPIPSQTRCLTTWDAAGSSVKWLLVDMQHSKPTDPGRPLRIRPAEAKEPQQPLQVEERDGRLFVDTGVLRVVFRTIFPIWEKPFDPSVLSECSVRTETGRRNLLRGGAPVLFMKDQHGTIYDSRFATAPPTVTLEEQGPLRVCVLVRGVLASPAGVLFCRYHLRMHLYAGRPDIRVFHTFVFDQDPHRVKLSSVGLHLPVDLGTRLRGAVSRSPKEAASFATNWQRLSLLQRHDRSFEITRDLEAATRGERAHGWASLAGSNGAVAVAVRDFWQEYPKGLTVDEEGIEVGIWPESCGEHLVFSTPFEEPAVRFSARDEAHVARLLSEHPTAPLNLKSLNIRSVEDAQWVEDVMERLAPSRTKSYNDTGTDNGIGAAKTTEMLFRFSTAPVEDDQAAAMTTAVNEPLTAVVDPAYVCATGVFDHYLPAGDTRFAQADADLDDYFDPIVVDPVERCRLYGMMRFGNLVCVHSSAIGWLYLLYKDTDSERALRFVGPYNNEANDQVMAVWGQFLRTGNPRYRRIAERYSRAVADVAFIHAHPTRPERIGLMHYHNAHQWSGSPSPSHSVVSGLLTDYFMTGNARLLDVVQEAADRIVATQEPAGILSCRHGTLHREFTGPLAILLESYEATWKEQYGRLAERSLSWLLRLVRTPGRLPNGIFTSGPRGDEARVTPDSYPEVAWGNKYHLYAPARRLFPSHELEAFLIAESDYWTWDSPRDLLNYACTTVCFGYELTGNMAYAAYAKDLIEGRFHQAVESMRREEAMDFAATRFSGYVPRLMAIVADAMDRDADAFRRACHQWLTKRDGRPDRPEEPRPDRVAPTSLGVVSAEPLQRL